MVMIELVTFIGFTHYITITILIERFSVHVKHILSKLTQSARMRLYLNENKKIEEENDRNYTTFTLPL